MFQVSEAPTTSIGTAADHPHDPSSKWIKWLAMPRISVYYTIVSDDTIGIEILPACHRILGQSVPYANFLNVPGANEQDMERATGGIPHRQGKHMDDDLSFVRVHFPNAPSDMRRKVSAVEFSCVVFALRFLRSLSRFIFVGVAHGAGWGRYHGFFETGVRD